MAGREHGVGRSGGGAPEDLKLQGGFTLSQFQDMRDALQVAITALEDLENGREIAAANRDNLKASLRRKLGQFRAMLRATLPKTKYAAASPLMPHFGSSESKFLAPFDDMASLWTKINADVTIPGFTPPLVIAGITLALFQTDLAALRGAYLAVTTAENDERIGRKERDALLPDARERMVQYRAAVEAVLGPNHPLTQSLPDLTPQPGSTPDPVTLTGLWNELLQAASFTWTASTNPNLLEYELRMSPGPTYDDGTAQVIDNAPPGTLSLSNSTGLTNPGDVASFKVFARITTGNEAGSNTVTITRP